MTVDGTHAQAMRKGSHMAKCSTCKDHGTRGKRGCPECHRKLDIPESDCERRQRGIYRQDDYGMIHHYRNRSDRRRAKHVPVSMGGDFDPDAPRVPRRTIAKYPMNTRFVGSLGRAVR